MWHLYFLQSAELLVLIYLVQTPIYHTFNSSGIFTVTSFPAASLYPIDLLVVGGGGGGSYPNRGGNGGSGIVVMRYSSTYPIIATYTNATFYTTGTYNVYVWTSSGSIGFTPA